MNLIHNEELYHHGTRGMKWGQRLYQNPDGTLTALGRLRYRKSDGTLTKAGKRAANRMREDYESERKLYKGLTGKRLTYDLNKHKKQLATAKDQDSLRNKKISEMTDDELKKEITRLSNENYLKQLRTQNDPPKQKGESFIKKIWKTGISEGISQAGRNLTSKLLTTAGNKAIEDAYKKPVTELQKIKEKAEIAKYKKQIETDTAQTYNQRMQADKNRREMESYFMETARTEKAIKAGQKQLKKLLKESKNKTNNDQFGEDLVEKFTYEWDMDPSKITTGKGKVYNILKRRKH